MKTDQEYRLHRQIDRLVRNREELRCNEIYHTPTQAYRMDTTTIVITFDELRELQQIIRDTLLNITLLEEARPTKSRRIKGFLKKYRRK
jgi:hypothetical protein